MNGGLGREKSPTAAIASSCGFLTGKSGKKEAGGNRSGGELDLRRLFETSGGRFNTGGVFCRRPLSRGGCCLRRREKEYPISGHKDTT